MALAAMGVEILGRAEQAPALCAGSAYLVVLDVRHLMRNGFFAHLDCGDDHRTASGSSRSLQGSPEGLWCLSLVADREGRCLLRSPVQGTQRDFARLVVASAFGFAGPPAVGIVLAWMSVSAYDLPTGHHPAFAAWSLALLGISATIPTLAFAFFSGTLADRMNRRSLLRTSTALGFLGTLLLAGVFYVDPKTHVGAPGPSGFYVPEWFLLALPLWAIVAVAAALARPTLNSAIPQVVPRESLGSANGLILSISLAISGVGTLTVGYVLSMWGPVLTLLIPLGLFEVAAVGLLTLESDVTGTRRTSHKSFARDMAAGLQYVGQRTGLLEITLASLGINFFVSVAAVEIPLYVNIWLLQGAVVLGALTFVTSLGTAVGTSAVNLIKYDRAPGGYLALCVVLAGAVLLVLPLTHSLYVALAVMSVFGLFAGMLTTIYIVVIQRVVPNELLGRVFAADEVGSFALIPLGQSVGGAITAVKGLAFTYYVTGGGTVVLGTVMGALKDLHRFAAGKDRPAQAVGPG